MMIEIYSYEAGARVLQQTDDPDRTLVEGERCSSNKNRILQVAVKGADISVVIGDPSWTTRLIIAFDKTSDARAQYDRILVQMDGGGS